MKHIKQEKREDIYWVTAMMDKLEASSDFYAGEQLGWLESIRLSCEAFVKSIFKGVDQKEMLSILNFAKTVRPILHTDKLYGKNTLPDNIIKCDCDDVYGLSEFALEYCADKCKKDYGTCKLREYLRNLQVPPWNEKMNCEYEREEN